jgi:glutathionyl-hydroquinone reductase
MLEVDAHLARDGPGAPRSFLVGDRVTIADIRLFNTLIRMDEVYVAYFKTYFASLFAPFGEERGRFPNLLRFTAEMYARFAEVRECVVMDDIRNHYFTSHAIRNMFAVVPREVGVLRALDKIAVAQAKSGEQRDGVVEDSASPSPSSA